MTTDPTAIATTRSFDCLNIQSARTMGLLAAACLLLFSGIRLLMLPDEGRYVGVAWEMVASGNWLVPTLDGMPYFHKPPLFYWLTAATMSVFGASEWGVRLVSASAAWATVMALYCFIRHYKNSQTATLAALILLTQPYFFLGAQFANMDMLVASMISLTVLSGAHAVLQAEQSLPYRRFVVLMYVFSALALLSKGLIGLVIPAAVLFLWLMVDRRFKGVLRLLWWPGMVAFAAVAAPWFVAMQAKFAGFYDYFFVYHHFQRFAAKGFNGVEPIYFYPVVIMVLALPWSLIWLRAFKRGVLRGAVQALPQFGSLLWMWFGVVVVFFSIPDSKLMGYVLPALPAMAVLLAVILPQWGSASEPNQARKVFVWALGAALAICVAIVIMVHQRPNESVQPLTQQFVKQLEPNDEVFVLGQYPFDLGFYLQFKKPFWIVGDWASPEIVKRDNWVKELYDAREFQRNAPISHLLQTQSFEAQLCKASKSNNTWVWAARDAVVGHPGLAQIEPSYKDDRSMIPRRVWQFKRNDPALAKVCRGQ